MLIYNDIVAAGTRTPPVRVRTPRVRCAEKIP
jgi:hypothetical protein